MLAEELLWAREQCTYRKESILNNRKFIEDAADYKINMKIITTNTTN
jgi:hypothetical protein